VAAAAAPRWQDRPQFRPPSALALRTASNHLNSSSARKLGEACVRPSGDSGCGHATSHPQMPAAIPTRPHNCRGGGAAVVASRLCRLNHLRCPRRVHHPPGPGTTSAWGASNRLLAVEAFLPHSVHRAASTSTHPHPTKRQLGWCGPLRRAPQLQGAVHPALARPAIINTPCALRASDITVVATPSLSP